MGSALLIPQQIIAEYNVKAKKSLGQNFLVCEKTLSDIFKIVKSLKLHNVLEIGPGVGSLTNLLLASQAQNIICVEKDDYIFSILKKYESDRLHFINDDALSIDEDMLFKKEKYSIVANLPYNIGTTLLTKWIDQSGNIESMCLMFQKEVAERIVASAGSSKYGTLSIFTQLYFKAEILYEVPNTAFSPKPKVSSAIVLLSKLDSPRFIIDNNKLEKYGKIIFSMRRKMLRKSLKNFLSNPDILLEKLNISPTKRPEELSIEEFCCLINEL